MPYSKSIYLFLPVGGGDWHLEWTGLGSRRNAGGGGRCSKLPMELVVLVIDEVLLIGGGGFWVCIEPRLSKVLRIVPVPIASKKKSQNHVKITVMYSLFSIQY